MKLNNNDDYKNKTKIYKITFNNDELYEDNVTFLKKFFIKTAMYTFIWYCTYNIINYIISNQQLLI